MIKNKMNIRARYAETDAMGIVHHSVYLVWFEAGRSEFMRMTGYPYGELEDDGFMLPLSESTCKYKNPVRYDEEITLETSIKEIKSATLTLQYEVKSKEADEVLVSGTTTHAFVNKEFKPVRMKKEVPKFYEIMHNAYKAKGE